MAVRDQGDYTPNRGYGMPRQQSQTPFMGPANTTPAGPSYAPDPSAATSQVSPSSMPSGMDPRLAQLYQQYGLAPADRGTGFADWQYWQDLGNRAGWDYTLGRLGADLAGTGSDRSTGTPGQGSWSSSGGGVASSGQGGGGSFGGFNVPLSSSALAGYRPMSDQLMNYVMGRGTGQISDSSLPALQVSATDPIIKNQVDAYRAEQERGVRSALSQAAEGNAGGAIPGAQGATARSLEEQAGQKTSGYEATLMGQELQSRRQELQAALQGAMGFMTQEQQIAAQDELARVEAALQESQFSRGLAEQGLEFGANQNLAYASL